MTLKELIEYVDEIKPNAFSNTTKTMWVNELDGKIQTEVWLLGDHFTHLYESVYIGTISFDGNSMTFSSAPNVRVNGLLTVDGSTYNDGTYKILSVDGKALTFVEEFDTE